MKKERKMNNRGFSLVELIIVIAIMAILAAILAPQLMRYVDKARKSTDISNCNSIKVAVETALADEAAYQNAPTGSFTFNGSAPSDAALEAGDFKTELTKIIGDWPSVKQKGAANFKVTIDADKKVIVKVVDKDGKEDNLN